MELVFAILAALILFKWLQTGEIWGILAGALVILAVGGLLFFIAILHAGPPSPPSPADEMAGVVMGVTMAIAGVFIYGWAIIVAVRKVRTYLRPPQPPGPPTGLFSPSE